MKLHILGNRKQTGYTTWGCMWKQGECAADAKLLLTGQSGSRLPMQSRITAYWPDGSVKWTAHTADAALLGKEAEVVAAPAAASPAEMYNTAAASPAVMYNTAAPAGVCTAPSAMEKTGSVDADGITVEKASGGMTVRAGDLVISIPQEQNRLFDRVTLNGRVRMLDGEPVLFLEEPSETNGCSVKTQRPYRAVISEITLEEEGPLQVIVKYTGCHEAANGERRIPFIIRMKVGLNSGRLNFLHTFLYDGDEDRDFLKGLGVRFRVPMKGAMYNRHVKFTGDHGVFHESAAQLVSWQPRVPQEIYSAQNRGEKLEPAGADAEILEKVLSAMPFWNEYDLCQDNVNHFAIRKKMADGNCCYLDCLHGGRTMGGAAFGSEDGSVLFSIRDFWETYPSGYTFRGLDTDTAEAEVWLWSPKAEAMDFRHYANRGYNQVCYEGYDYKGATPYGIASTSEYSLAFCDDIIPADEALEDFADSVKRPAQYVGSPEYYHEHQAFGYWSLPMQDTETERWLEEQLDGAFSFYKEEAAQRNWYGLFNYGDFMHTYDKERHQWRYDIGGYAWDNTELVPTLWLWYYFLRTGREDVFTLAEKLSRHTSEVDVYHMGKYKGLGSRHNVRHWGCPCKEARIAMAAHHRFYYYMTGDRRLEDIFGELKDNEFTFLNKDPMGDFYDKESMVYPSHARSGPDWSSLCANWMTQWERTQDTAYRDKMITGMEDIKNSPLKLISGPVFEFDPASCHLRYIGERLSGGVHLQICMGSPQVWMEMADLLDDEEWKSMLAEYGRFYFLSPEQQREETGGIIGKREFSLPMFATAMGAYGAAYHQSREEAERALRCLLQSALSKEHHEGFRTITVENAGNRAELKEIPWISTNYTAQWCLNVITALEFVRQWLPRTLAEADKLVAEAPGDVFRRS